MFYLKLFNVRRNIKFYSKSYPFPLNKFTSEEEMIRESGKRN